MRLRLLGVAAVVVLTVACTSTTNDNELLVSAAASLTDVFGEIETAFELANPGVDVVLNLGGSSALREQILEGAPADVFASANEDTMNEVMSADLTRDEPQFFAANRLQIAVPPGNPAGITGLGDFANDGLFLGLCAVGVPCGDLARTALARARVNPAPDTAEPDVRSLLAKIESGELDGGITYVTDVTGADGRVDGVVIPDELNVATRYPIAVLVSAQSPRLAVSFVEFVVAGAGHGIVESHGFEAP